MASFTLTLDDDTLRKLTEAARNAGVTPERAAEIILEQWISAEVGPDRAPPGVSEPARAWAGESDTGSARHGQHTTAESYEGPFTDLDEALDTFSAELRRRLTSSTG